MFAKGGEHVTFLDEGSARRALVSRLPAVGAAQGRTTGQIVGTVKDASGAVVPKADLILIDNGTGATTEAKSGSDGGFVFPNLQPGRYQITATVPGLQPDHDPGSRRRNRPLGRRRRAVRGRRPDRAGQRRRPLAGRRDDVDDGREHRQQRADREAAAGRPQHPRTSRCSCRARPRSAGGRDSQFNGLPGGAINITLDGINNNSARFRSGGTSLFMFAPVRLGAIEEVTVSTAGLTADAGAEGAVQIQFVTKRGTNAFRGQVFDQIQSDKLNAQGPSTSRAASRRRSCGSTSGAPTSAARSSRTSCSSSATTSRSTRRARRRGTATSSTPKRSRASSATAAPTTPSGPSTSSRSRAPTASRRRSTRSSRSSSRRSTRSLGQGNRRCARTCSQNTFSFIDPADAEHEYLSDGTRRLSGDVEPRDPRRAEPALARPADATRYPGLPRSTTASRRPTTSSRPAPTGRFVRTCSTR